MNRKELKRDFTTYGGRKALVVRDYTPFNDEKAWEEVKGIKASEITHRDEDNERLDGLIIRGYEMKWGETNANGERYEKGAFDAFINEWYVNKGFNMVVDINHEGYKDHYKQCGRVLYIETNSVGFYFVVYINRGYSQYDDLKWRLEQGLLQGFSKEGFATDWEWKWKEDGTFDYELIKEIAVVSVSLVPLPANGVQFEKVQEVKNGTHYINKTITAQHESTMNALFNNK